MQVKLSSRAEADLSQIYSDVQAEFSPTAYAWYRGLIRSIEALAAAPEAGKLLQRDSKQRRILYGSGRNVYKIVYQIAHRQQCILIARIVHGRRLAAEKWS